VDKVIKGTGINAWPKDDRPREKLLRHGENALSDAELLAIILRVGVSGHSALDLARAVINKFGSFRELSQAGPLDWKEFKGLGDAKISQIRAAIEIGKRFYEGQITTKKIKIEKADDVFSLLSPRMRDLKKEVFKVLYLDTKNRLINIIELGTGTVNEVNPIVREIFHKALEYCASSFICAHNHPSGSCEPSVDDRNLTKDILNVSKPIKINFLDHVIIGDNSFYSFANEGFIDI
jgi:DNA repair protein RadC